MDRWTGDSPGELGHVVNRVSEYFLFPLPILPTSSLLPWPLLIRTYLWSSQTFWLRRGEFSAGPIRSISNNHGSKFPHDVTEFYLAEKEIPQNVDVLMQGRTEIFLALPVCSSLWYCSWPTECGYRGINGFPQLWHRYHVMYMTFHIFTRRAECAQLWHWVYVHTNISNTLYPILMSVSEPLHTSLSELNSVCSVSRKWQKCFAKWHPEPGHTYSEKTRLPISVHSCSCLDMCRLQHWWLSGLCWSAKIGQ